MVGGEARHLSRHLPPAGRLSRSRSPCVSVDCPGLPTAVSAGWMSLACFRACLCLCWTLYNAAGWGRGPRMAPTCSAAGRPSPGSQPGPETALVGRGCEQPRQGSRGAVPGSDGSREVPCTWLISDLSVGGARGLRGWHSLPVCLPGSLGHGGG